MKMCISKKLGKSALSVHPFFYHSTSTLHTIQTNYVWLLFFRIILFYPHFKILYTRVHTHTPAHTHTDSKTNCREKRRKKGKEREKITTMLNIKVELLQTSLPVCV